jgi:tyrosinase
MAVSLAGIYNATHVATVSREPDFHSFAYSLEGGPHGAIHAALGGEMAPSTSPNEPLFFLHHPQIDALWWRWQQQNPATRLTEFAGNRNSPTGGPAGNATLDDVLLMNGIAPDITVREIMDTSDPRWCYKY